MKLPDFESPSGDSLPKSANFGLSKWIFYVKNYPSFFLQNREKSKYRFLTFLPVTWVKIELQKGTIHQMNGWNLYFLVDFYAIIENSTWGALGPRMLLSNSSNHPLIQQNKLLSYFGLIGHISRWSDYTLPVKIGLWGHRGRSCGGGGQAGHGWRGVKPRLIEIRIIHP